MNIPAQIASASSAVAGTQNPMAATNPPANPGGQFAAIYALQLLTTDSFEESSAVTATGGGLQQNSGFPALSQSPGNKISDKKRFSDPTASDASAMSMGSLAISVPAMLPPVQTLPASSTGSLSTGSLAEPEQASSAASAPFETVSAMNAPGSSSPGAAFSSAATLLYDAQLPRLGEPGAGEFATTAAAPSLSGQSAGSANPVALASGGAPLGNNPSIPGTTTTVGVGEPQPLAQAHDLIIRAAANRLSEPNDATAAALPAISADVSADVSAHVNTEPCRSPEANQANAANPASAQSGAAAGVAALRIEDSSPQGFHWSLLSTADSGSSNRAAGASVEAAQPEAAVSECVDATAASLPDQAAPGAGQLAVGSRAQDAAVSLQFEPAQNKLDPRVAKNFLPSSRPVLPPLPDLGVSDVVLPMGWFAKNWVSAAAGIAAAQILSPDPAPRTLPQQHIASNVTAGILAPGSSASRTRNGFTAPDSGTGQPATSAAQAASKANSDQPSQGAAAKPAGNQVQDDPANSSAISDANVAPASVAPAMQASVVAATPASPAKGADTSPQNSPPPPSSSPDSIRNPSGAQPGFVAQSDLPALHNAPVQIAQIVNRAAQSEMRVEMNTAAFGSVEVRTTVHANDVGVLIGSEKGDLRALLANELPGIASSLQQQNLRLHQVNFLQGFASGNDMSSQGGSESRSFAAPSRTVPASVEREADTTDVAAAEGWGAPNRSGHLSVLA